MEHPGEMIALGISGGAIGLIIFSLFKYCYKKELYTKCKSNCCETNLEVIDNSSPMK
jgi:hypothetical protein